MKLEYCSSQLNPSMAPVTHTYSTLSLLSHHSLSQSPFQSCYLPLNLAITFSISLSISLSSPTRSQSPSQSRARSHSQSPSRSRSPFQSRSRSVLSLLLTLSTLTVGLHLQFGITRYVSLSQYLFEHWVFVGICGYL